MYYRLPLHSVSLHTVRSPFAINASKGAMRGNKSRQWILSIRLRSALIQLKASKQVVVWCAETRSSSKLILWMTLIKTKSLQRRWGSLTQLRMLMTVRRSQQRRRKRRRDTRRPQRTLTWTCLTYNRLMMMMSHGTQPEAMCNMLTYLTPCQIIPLLAPMVWVQVVKISSKTLQCLMRLHMVIPSNTEISRRTHPPSSFPFTTSLPRSMRLMTFRTMARVICYITALAMICRETARTSAHMLICTSQANSNWIFRTEVQLIRTCLKDSKWWPMETSICATAIRGHTIASLTTHLITRFFEWRKCNHTLCRIDKTIRQTKLT